MTNLTVLSDPRVELVFEKYPEFARTKLLQLRNIILGVAEESANVSEIEETLKWGEPSYLTKNGSTIRIDWKSKTPNQYAVYFKCTSKLVPSFEAVFNDTFNYEGNRAIVFQMKDKLPVEALKKCIAAGLTYHSVKGLPNLGL
ncbi:MAG: DUF1801 domain-containing protein [Saprospiraceae bacterium]|nr:DUF1801 domain-containing protein [Saprospiraceae bacterium]